MIPDDADTTKKLVVIIGSIIAFLLIIWLLIGAPIIGIRFLPLSTSTNVPSWQDGLAERKEIDSAYQNGYYNEDPDRRALRQQALDALDAFQNNPCDTQQKEAFIEAAEDFFIEMNKNFRQESSPTKSMPETFSFNNKIISGRSRFDSPVYEKMIEGFSDPRIKESDLPKKLRRYKPTPEYLGEEALEDQGCL